MKNQKSTIQKYKNIDFEMLPSISGIDTIEFNKNIVQVGTNKKINSLANWIKIDDEGTMLYYLVEQKKVNGFKIHELKVFNVNKDLIVSKMLEDTNYVFKAPERRTSIAYRRSNWFYIESGLKSADSTILIKFEKFEIHSLLGKSYDDLYLKIE
ncbi:MAG: hypothetical protein HYZ42_16165 [Bacteroidetes bacterium]|nr:hypothetical protein [Bacteroidota bacterium]